MVNTNKQCLNFLLMILTEGVKSQGSVSLKATKQTKLILSRLILTESYTTYKDFLKYWSP